MRIASVSPIAFAYGSYQPLKCPGNNIQAQARLYQFKFHQAHRTELIPHQVYPREQEGGGMGNPGKR